MPPPKDLPGFYFDSEKNRYFPIKGPIPGSKRLSSSRGDPCGEPSGSNQKHQICNAEKRKRIKPSSLLQFRELHGRNLISSRCKYNFKHEYEKLQASHPLVWKYQSTAYTADTALEQFHGTAQTPRGVMESYLLLTGSVNSCVSLYEVGNVEENFDYGLKSMPELVWPPITRYKEVHNSAVGYIRSPAEGSICFPSEISCIQRVGQPFLGPSDDASSLQNALVTTLGSGMCGGSVYTLDLTEPVDFSQSACSLYRRLTKIVSIDHTIWTADCSSNRTQAIIGTDRGAALINLETRRISWVYHTKSDIFSQQFTHSENVALCGLRNGSIIAVDVRQKKSSCFELSSRPFTSTMPRVHKGSHGSPVRHDEGSSKQMPKLKQTLNSWNSGGMSSSVCSLMALQSDDQYFLGSSMDGFIKLFDCRLIHRGPVQSYEGNVNSHSHLQLGVNPSETLVLSGGEDSCVRVWSIKTGELIFEEKVSNSVPVAVCWPKGTSGFLKPPRCYEENSYEVNQSWGAWLGSRQGLLYMHGT